MSMDPNLELRDLFAGFAFVALHAMHAGTNADELKHMNPRKRATWCYEMADELIEAKAKNPAK